MCVRVCCGLAPCARIFSACAVHFYIFLFYIFFCLWSIFCAVCLCEFVLGLRCVRECKFGLGLCARAGCVRVSFLDHYIFMYVREFVRESLLRACTECALTCAVWASLVCTCVVFVSLFLRCVRKFVLDWRCVRECALDSHCVRELVWTYAVCVSRFWTCAVRALLLYRCYVVPHACPHDHAHDPMMPPCSHSHIHAPMPVPMWSCLTNPHLRPTSPFTLIPHPCPHDHIHDPMLPCPYPWPYVNTHAPMPMLMSMWACLTHPHPFLRPCSSSPIFPCIFAHAYTHNPHIVNRAKIGKFLYFPRSYIFKTCT